MGMQDAIREMREKTGLSQQDVANALGVNRSAVSQWETGRNNPDSKKIPLLAEVLGCSMQQLFDVAESRPASTEDVSAQPVSVEILPQPTVPLITLGRVHAGDFSEEELIGRTVEVPEWVMKKHPHAKALLVEGDCMNRVIPSGYFAIYDPDLEPTNTKVAVVETMDHQVLMRRWHKGQNTLLLSADSYMPFDDIVLSDDTPIRVYGTVVYTVAPDDLL